MSAPTERAALVEADSAPQYAREPVTRAEIVRLAALVLAALVLRLVGIDWMLPHATEPDAIVACTQVDLLERGATNPERVPNFGFYPHLLARAVLPFYSPPVPAEPGAPLAEHLERAGTLHRTIRTVVALLSVLLVPATWAIARRFLGAAGALTAALLAATSVLHLWFSGQARPHAFAAAFAALAIVALLRLRRRGEARDYALAGLAIGLAIGALQNGLAVLPALVVAIALRARTARTRSIAWALVTIAVAAACVALFYPFLFATDDGKGAARLGVEDAQLNLSGHLVYFGLFQGGGFRTVLETLVGYEPWITLLAAIGLVLGLVDLVLGRRRARGTEEAASSRERRADLAVVLAYALPYLLVIGLYGRTYQRFVIPLVPYLALLAAATITRAAAFFARRSSGAGSFAAGTVVLLLLAPEVALALRFVWLRTQPDTTTLAARWVAENLAPDARIAVQPPVELPLPATASALDANAWMMENLARPWYLYQRTLRAVPEPAWSLRAMPLESDAERAALDLDPESYLRALDAAWLVIDVYAAGRRPLVLNRIPPALPAVATRVARFSPDRVDDGNDVPLTYADDEYGEKNAWALRLWRARAFGPVIEIWRTTPP